MTAGRMAEAVITTLLPAHVSSGPSVHLPRASRPSVTPITPDGGPTVDPTLE